LLADHNIGVLVVVDAAGQLAGILSERDIVRRAAEDEALLANLSLR
jgi:CBS domain-containing protein